MKRVVFLFFIIGILLASGSYFCDEKISQKVLDFMEAAKSGDIQKAQALLAKGVDVNAKSTFDWNALLYAVDKGHKDMCQFLVSKGADVNASVGGWRTALIIAASAGDMDTAELLISKGADISGQRGTEALMSAVTGKSLYDLWEDKGAWEDRPKNEAEIEAFMRPYRKGQNEIIKLLIEKGVDINARRAEGWTALLLAADKGDVEKCELLVNYGAQISGALFAARGKKVCEFLIKKGEDVNKKDGQGESALLRLAQSNSWEACETLLENGAVAGYASPKDGKTALFYAAKENNKEMCEHLILKGCDINAKDNKGRTALFSAVANYTRDGSKETTELLLTKGADPNVKDADSETPLFKAVQSGNKEAVRLLISKGADVNIKNKEGKTALFFDVASHSCNDNEMAIMLISAGIDVNTVANDGSTPLMNAIRGSREGFIKPMIDAGVILPKPAILIGMGCDYEHITTLDGKKTPMDKPVQLTPGTHKLKLKFKRFHGVISFTTGYTTAVRNYVQFDAEEEGIYIFKATSQPGKESGDIFYYGPKGTNIKVSY